MRYLPSFFAVLFAAAAVACGASSSSSPSSAAGSSPTADGGDASTEAGPDVDECTPQGPIYECHTYNLCNGGYMPVHGVSCGTPTKFCCVKGALNPQDAGTD